MKMKGGMGGGMDQHGKGQLKHSGPCPEMAKCGDAPSMVKEHEKAHSHNTLDPAKGAGRQRGDGAKE